jgi:hypothetical protein
MEPDLEEYSFLNLTRCPYSFEESNIGKDLERFSKTVKVHVPEGKPDVPSPNELNTINAY